MKRSLSCILSQMVIRTKIFPFNVKKKSRSSNSNHKGISVIRIVLVAVVMLLITIIVFETAGSESDSHDILKNPIIIDLKIFYCSKLLQMDWAQVIKT